MGTKKSNIISLIFAAVGIQLVFCAINGSFNLVFSAFILLGTIILYKLYDLVYVKGPIVYILILAGTVLSVYLLLSNVTGESVSFPVWLLSGGNLISSNFYYLVSAAIILTLFLSTMFYYFTINIVRPSILLLLYMIVIIFYIKGSFSANSIMLYLFIGGYIAQFMFYSRAKNMENVNIESENKAIYKVGGVILLIVFVVSMLIPKPGSLPRMEFLDKTKSYIDGTVLKDSMSKFDITTASNRTINRSIKENEDIELFSISANPRFLVYNVLDKYENETWSENEIGIYQTQVEFSRMEKAILKNKIVNSSSDNEIIKSWRDKIQNESILDSDVKDMTINFDRQINTMDKLPHPINTIGVTDNSSKRLFVDKDTIYASNKHPLSGMYNMTYYADESKEDSFETWILKNSNKDIINLLEKEIGFFSDSYIEYDFNAKNRYLQIPEDIEEDVYKITNEITKDKKNYYDKAKAIEEYLKKGDYRYSLSIGGNSNNSDYINYFILEGKVGYCVQFATAMTLMCRIAGLEARYTEGYYVGEDDKKGDSYVVNAKKSHAFVEVRIPGYGWKIFDPTTSIMADETNGKSLFDFSRFFTYKSFVNIVSVVLIVAVLWFAIRIVLRLTKRKRKLFMILRKNDKEAFEGLMSYSISLADTSLLGRYKEETFIKYAKRLDEAYNIGIYDLAKLYYGFKYNDIDVINKELIKQALKLNDDIYKLIKEKNK